MPVRFRTRPVRGRRRGVAAAVLVAITATAAICIVTATTPHAAADVQGKPVTRSVTATRTHIVDGVEKLAEKRTISMTVATTTQLRDQQPVHITWSGAHPTSNISPDPNSSTAYSDEYPMVLLECRGVDSTAVPESQRLTQQTCWTPAKGTRSALNGFGANSRLVDTDVYPAWRLDRYADPLDRERYSREPADRKGPQCPNLDRAAEHRLPFVAANGTVYYGSGGVEDNGCGSSPPEAATGVDATTVATLPDNAAFVPTAMDGTGEYDFNIRDNRTNASLGCSSTVACAIVAIPIMGISCDGGAGLPEADRPKSTEDWPSLPQDVEGECEREGLNPPGFVRTGSNAGQYDYAVSGALWWSESNWKNRLTFPITMAPPANACDLISSKEPVAVYGSELMIQATTQWSAALCQSNASTPFKHISTPEPLARNLLGTSIEAAFTSYPPAAGYPVPTVHAPVAATGFAVSFLVDGNGGKQLHELKLTPRLLAKLVTESYPGFVTYPAQYTRIVGGKETHPLKNNPNTIFNDPEFRALNPGAGSDLSTFGATNLITLSGNSDTVHALTEYINDDPEARRWLDGKPDPWGMVVNPNYEQMSLPVDSIAALDTWTPVLDPEKGCAPKPDVPALPLFAAPLTRLADVQQAVQYGVPAAQVECSTSINPADNSRYDRWKRVSRLLPGTRFVLGLTTLADAERYALDTAELQTSSSVDPAEPMTSADGRTFVAPTDTALKEAFKAARKTDATWALDRTALRSNPKAYPGAMLVFADIPTQGLSAADAAGYSQMLDYIAGPGQIPGVGVGELPAGYIPMTKANGLAALAADTHAAAAAVLAQGKTAPTQPTVVVSKSPKPAPALTFGARPASTPETPSAATPNSSSPDASTAAPAVPATPSPLVPISQPKLTAGTTQGTGTSVQVLLGLLLLALLAGPVVVPVLLYRTKAST